MLLGVNVQTAASRKPGSTTFCMALEGLGAQMGDTVTFQVLCPGEGFPTSLLCAHKAAVIIVFPFMSEQLGHACEGPSTAL